MSYVSLVIVIIYWTHSWTKRASVYAKVRTISYRLFSKVAMRIDLSIFLSPRSVFLAVEALDVDTCHSILCIFGRGFVGGGDACVRSSHALLCSRVWFGTPPDHRTPVTVLIWNQVLIDWLFSHHIQDMSRPLLFFIFLSCPIVSAFPWLSVLPYFMAHWSRNRHLPRLDPDCARSCRSRGECTSRITCLQLLPQHLTLLCSFFAGTITRMVGRVASDCYCVEQTNVTWMSWYLCLVVIFDVVILLNSVIVFIVWYYIKI